MQGGEDVTKHKSDEDFIKEIKGIDESFIKQTEEVCGATLKRNLLSMMMVAYSQRYW